MAKIYKRKGIVDDEEVIAIGDWLILEPTMREHFPLYNAVIKNGGKETKYPDIYYADRTTIDTIMDQIGNTLVEDIPDPDFMDAGGEYDGVYFMVENIDFTNDAVRIGSRVRIGSVFLILGNWVFLIKTSIVLGKYDKYQYGKMKHYTLPLDASEFYQNPEILEEFRNYTIGKYLSAYTLSEEGTHYEDLGNPDKQSTPKEIRVNTNCIIPYYVTVSKSHLRSFLSHGKFMDYTGKFYSQHSVWSILK